VFRASGLGGPDDTEQLRRRVAELEQTTVDLRQQLEERAEELEAARATNRELMAEVNRLPGRWPSADTPRKQRRADERPPRAASHRFSAAPAGCVNPALPIAPSTGTFTGSLPPLWQDGGLTGTCAGPRHPRRPAPRESRGRRPGQAWHGMSGVCERRLPLPEGLDCLIWCLRMLEAAALVLVLILIVLLMVAWLLEDIAAKVTRLVDSFLIPAAERFGDLGAAWQRLVAAAHAALARWRG
jgi:hypothetical protein